MKIVVVADSHTDVPTMLDVVNAEQPDCIFHLGDHVADALDLQKHIDIEMHLVKGNTDQGNDGKKEELVIVDNKRILLTHGHAYNAEKGLARLWDAGARNQAHIVLFGHTHKPHLSYIDGIWLMNPGRIGRKSSKKIHATYGVIRMTGSQIRCEISEVDLGAAGP